MRGDPEHRGKGELVVLELVAVRAKRPEDECEEDGASHVHDQGEEKDEYRWSVHEMVACLEQVGTRIDVHDVVRAQVAHRHAGWLAHLLHTLLDFVGEGADVLRVVHKRAPCPPSCAAGDACASPPHVVGVWCREHDGRPAAILPTTIRIEAVGRLLGPCRLAVLGNEFSLPPLLLFVFRLTVFARTAKSRHRPSRLPQRAPRASRPAKKMSGPESCSGQERVSVAQTGSFRSINLDNLSCQKRGQ